MRSWFFRPDSCGRPNRRTTSTSSANASSSAASSSGKATSGSPCALPGRSITTPRPSRLRRSSPKPRNPWSASSKVGSLRSTARLRREASTGPVGVPWRAPRALCVTRLAGDVLVGQRGRRRHRSGLARATSRRRAAGRRTGTSSTDGGSSAEVDTGDTDTDDALVELAHSGRAG